MKDLIYKGLKLYNTYKMPILYIFFGGLTTLINIMIYFISYNLIKIGNVPSTIIAWIISVIFAFVTNKLYVFESHSKSISYELSAFFACRLGTGLLDVAIMYISVDILTLNALIMKIISNLLVIILNYIFSKIIIFR